MAVPLLIEINPYIVVLCLAAKIYDLTFHPLDSRPFFQLPNFSIHMPKASAGRFVQMRTLHNVFIQKETLSSRVSAPSAPSVRVHHCTNILIITGCLRYVSSLCLDYFFPGYIRHVSTSHVKRSFLSSPQTTINHISWEAMIHPAGGTATNTLWWSEVTQHTLTVSRLKVPGRW